MIETAPASERALRRGLSHLDALEAESVFIMREVAAEFERPVLLFSGGKDSSLVAHAVFEALQAIPPSARARPVHIVSNDTQVESPFVMAHLNKVTRQIEQALERVQHDPFSTYETYADMQALQRNMTHLQNTLMPQLQQSLQALRPQ